MSTATITNNLNRRALGDIGNKILPTNAHIGDIKKTAAPLTKAIIKTTQQQQQLLVEPQQQQLRKIVPEPIAESVLSSSNASSLDFTSSEDDDEDITDIVDIDELDIDNTQLVAEYVKDIYIYLNQMERRFRISPQFLDNKIVTSKMRSVLIDWLIQVHLKFHLLQETLYLCVQIIDAYLQAQDVPKMQLQLVGVTALFLASKYEEMYVPAIEDFVYMTDNTYTKAEIRHMEISILKTLDFMFGKPLPLHFLRRFSKAGQADPKQHTLAKYFMELSLHDAEFSSMDPSYLAASSLCLSFKLLNQIEWNRTLEFYSTYKKSSLVAGMQKLAKLVLKTINSDYKYRAATSKYSASKFMRISQLQELFGSQIKEIAASSTTN